MLIKIDIKNNKLMLELIDKDIVVDSRSVMIYHNLSELILLELDKILEKNRIDRSTINLEIGEMDADSVNYRILNAFRKGFSAADTV